MSTESADPTDPPEEPPHPAPRIDLRRGTLWMLVSLVCFTTNAMLLKHFATLHIDPWLSMSFRFFIGMVLTWLVFAPKMIRSFKSWLLASRGVLGGLGTAAYYLSIGPLGVGKATLIGNTWCVFAALIAVFVLKERLSLMRLAGIVLALTGVALLSGVNTGSLGADGHWELVSLTGAILAAAVVVVIRQLTKTETSATIFGSQCVWGLLLAVPLAMQHLPHLTGVSFGLMCVAALCAAGGQLAMTEGFRFLTVAAGGAFQMTLPLVISLGGVFLFDEHFNTLQLCGGVLIISGSFVAVLK